MVRTSGQLDLVIPAYNEGRCLYANMRTLTAFLEGQGLDYRLILVNDGSKDNTWAEISRLSGENPKVRGISFSRNFGKEAAICAGLEECRGDAVLVMDSDLQHPMDQIPTFFAKWQEGFDIVEGVKTSRGPESLLYKAASKSFYRLFRRLTKVDMDNSSDFKLLDKQVVSAFIRLRESSVFFRGMVSWLGFPSCQVPFSVQERQGDGSKFSTKALYKMAFGAMTSYSNVPLHLTNWIGVVFCIGAFLLGLQTLWNYFSGHAQSGFTTVIILILISSGAVLISLGIIGMYLSKIYEEVKGRPRYIVSERTYERNA